MGSRNSQGIHLHLHWFSPDDWSQFGLKSSVNHLQCIPDGIRSVSTILRSLFDQDSNKRDENKIW